VGLDASIDQRGASSSFGKELTLVADDGVLGLALLCGGSFAHAWILSYVPVGVKRQFAELSRLRK
jgi:hypothetical protein